MQYLRGASLKIFDKENAIMKTLIAYYSRAGNTKKAAQKIHSIVGGDIFEITGDKNYGSYFKALKVSHDEFASGEMPTVTSEVKDFDSYGAIFIGFPIWYSKCPQIVMSFISQYSFFGKDVYPFYTSGMSAGDDARGQLIESCAGATVHEALRMNNADETRIKSWLAR